MVLLFDRPNTPDVAVLDRYSDLIERGFSAETSAIVASAAVPLAAITDLLLPDGE
jgi:hypothetical protein